MDKSTKNTRIYQLTHERLVKLSDVTGKPMIELVDEAVRGLEHIIGTAAEKAEHPCT